MNVIKNKKMQTQVNHRNEYLNCMKNIIYALKIFAIFPFVHFNEKTKLGRLLSIALTTFSLIIYVIMIVKEEQYLYLTYFHILAEFNFINLIRFLLQVVLRLVILIFPFLTWNKNRYLRNYWDNWMVFQIEMSKLKRNSFKLTTVRHQIQGLFVILIILIAILGVLFAVQSSKFMATNLFSALYIFYNISHVTTYWIFNNFVIVGVAKKMIVLIQQTVPKGNVVELNRLIDLWIMLCDLNEQFIQGHSILFLIFFCLVVICGVISVFLSVILFVYYNNQSLGFAYLFGTFICILCILIFSESAYSVENHMVYKVKKQLLEEKLDIGNKPLLKVIQLFLHAIETRNPNVTFNGYMIINRSNAASILNATIQFLVVLKQFSPQYK